MRSALVPIDGSSHIILPILQSVRNSKHEIARFLLVWHNPGWTTERPVKWTTLVISEHRWINLDDSGPACAE